MTSLEARKEISKTASELMRGENLTAAKKFLDAHIAADPTDWRLSYQLGTCFDRMAKNVLGANRHALREDSAQAYAKASDGDPQDFYSANMAATQYLTLKQYGNALPYALRAHTLRRNDHGAKENMGRVYEGLGNTTQAVKFYREIVGENNRRSARAAARITALTA